MSNPIMMVRKIKNCPVKTGEFSESTKNIKIVLPGDLKTGLSSTQGPIFLNKTRSTSALKKTQNKGFSKNITPLSRKIRNLSYITGNTPDITENLVANTSADDHKFRILNNLESILAENRKKSNKKEVILDVLMKITHYDPCLKKIIGEIVDGLRESEENSLIDPELMKKTLTELTNERNKLKKDLERCKEVFRFMKNKGEIPVEKYFQEFNELEKVKDKKKDKINERKNEMQISESSQQLKTSEKNQSLSQKKLKYCEKPLNYGGVQAKHPEKLEKNPENFGIENQQAILKSHSMSQSMPKLALVPSGDFGFHQEFMSKANEFSESWRALIKLEKNM